jgi:predicted transcriptional regulator
MDKKEQPKRSSMDIIDVDKLLAQNAAGLSIRQLSIIHGLPYASLYRAIKGREENNQDDPDKNEVPDCQK